MKPITKKRLNLMSAVIAVIIGMFVCSSAYYMQIEECHTGTKHGTHTAKSEAIHYNNCASHACINSIPAPHVKNLILPLVIFLSFSIITPYIATFQLQIYHPPKR